MANKYQRKVNKSVKRFNKGFEKDIHPYNLFNIKQYKVMGDREPYEAMFLIHLYRDEKLVGSKWFQYYEIVGFGREVVGRRLFWWVNNSVAEKRGD